MAPGSGHGGGASWTLERRRQGRRRAAESVPFETDRPRPWRIFSAGVFRALAEFFFQAGFFFHLAFSSFAGILRANHDRLAMPAGLRSFYALAMSEKLVISCGLAKPLRAGHALKAHEVFRAYQGRHEVFGISGHQGRFRSQKAWLHSQRAS